jgi:NAD+ diphosphatase
MGNIHTHETRAITASQIDFCGPSSRNGFVGLSIDRASGRRRDDAWIESLIHAPSTRFLPIWQTRNYLVGEDVLHPVLLSPSDLQDFLRHGDPPVFLGMEGDTAYFAIDLPSDGSESTPVIPAAAASARFSDLKMMGPLLPREEGALLAYARAITWWHRQNHFCSFCGSPSNSAWGGHVRVCTNPSCARQHFPRTDPAIIVLVRSGDRCLLGRQTIWIERMYSALAGFVEPGESLEAAVIREVREETGIDVCEVRYHSSQPWPFPASIMLGFTARAENEQINLQDHELEDARWFSRSEIVEALKDGALRMPTPISIAYRLIEDWFDEGADVPLKNLLPSMKAS